MPTEFVYVNSPHTPINAQLSLAITFHEYSPRSYQVGRYELSYRVSMYPKTACYDTYVSDSNSCFPLNGSRLDCLLPNVFLSNPCYPWVLSEVWLKCLSGLLFIDGSYDVTHDHKWFNCQCRELLSPRWITGVV